MKLTLPLYRLIKQFKEPRTLQEIIPGQPRENVLGCVKKLVEMKFLVEEGGEENGHAAPATKDLTHTPYTFFHSPRYKAGSAVADISFVGIPYDLGTAWEPGNRKAPAELRLRSFDYEYRADFSTGTSMGWYDTDAQRRLLEGITICDWGDVRFTYGEEPAKIFERIGSIARAVRESGSFPVFIGGDHSITFPLVQSLDQKLNVCCLDAHTDFAVLDDVVCNNTNVMRAVRDLPQVERLVQVGHRGYTVVDKAGQYMSKTAVLTTHNVRRNGASKVIEELDANLPVYLSIDICVLDPIYAPGTNTPSPGGFTPRELKELLWMVGCNHQVICVDLVGINPDKDVGPLTRIMACRILLDALGSVMERRRTTAPKHDAQGTQKGEKDVAAI